MHAKGHFNRLTNCQLIGFVGVHAGKTREKAQLNSLSVLHVKGDPLEKADLTERIDLTK